MPTPLLLLLALAASDLQWKPRPLSEFVLTDSTPLARVDSLFMAQSPDRRKRRRPLDLVPTAALPKERGRLLLIGSSRDSGGLTYLAQERKGRWELRGVYHQPPEQHLPQPDGFRLAWDTILRDGRKIRYSTVPFKGKFLPPPDRFEEIDSHPHPCAPEDGVCTAFANAIRLDGTALESRACAQEPRFPGINCYVATSANPNLPLVLKPMLYLYPPDTLDVAVSMGRPERVWTSYPSLSPAGRWRVKAFPGGDLVDSASGKRLYGLYWEGHPWQAPRTDTGFCLPRERFGEWLDSLLERKGLNYREREEFITFWISRIAKPYVLVRFPERAYAETFPVHISPPPQAFVRVFATFQQTDSPRNLVTPQIPQVVRPAWTAVEWGGQEVAGD